MMQNMFSSVDPSYGQFAKPS